MEFSEGKRPTSGTDFCNGDFTFFGAEMLGKGGQGEVYRGRDNREDKPVALKIFKSCFLDISKLKGLNEEIEIMKETKYHNNIIRLRSFVQNTLINDEIYYVFAFELAERGELHEYLVYSPFESDLARTYFYQLVDAVDYCHMKKIIHRDISYRNILFTENFTLKLADFGLSVMNNGDVLQYGCGAVGFMAPEVVSRSEHDGTKADVWSAGVVLIYMLTRTMPFKNANSEDNRFNIREMMGEYDQFKEAFFHNHSLISIEHDAQVLLNEIFVAKSEDRCTTRDILTRAWLSNRLSSDGLKERMSERHCNILDKKRVFKRKNQQKEHEIARKKYNIGWEDNYRSPHVVSDHEHGTAEDKMIADNLAWQVSMTNSDTLKSVPLSLPKYDADVFIPAFGDSTIAPYQFLAHGADSIIDRLFMQLYKLSAISVEALNRDDNIIDATLIMSAVNHPMGDNGEMCTTPNSIVELEINVFEAPEEDGDIEEGLVLVVVKMKSGSIADFQQCFESIRCAALAEEYGDKV